MLLCLVLYKHFLYRIPPFLKNLRIGNLVVIYSLKKAVAQIENIDVQGNIIPSKWYINIKAKIVYWYRSFLEYFCRLCAAQISFIIGISPKEFQKLQINLTLFHRSLIIMPDKLLWTIFPLREFAEEYKQNADLLNYMHKQCKD